MNPETNFVGVKYTINKASEIPFTGYLDHMYDDREQGCIVLCDWKRIYEVKELMIKLKFLV